MKRFGKCGQRACSWLFLFPFVRPQHTRPILFSSTPQCEPRPSCAFSQSLPANSTNNILMSALHCAMPCGVDNAPAPSAASETHPDLHPQEMGDTPPQSSCDLACTHIMHRIKVTHELNCDTSRNHHTCHVRAAVPWGFVGLGLPPSPQLRGQVLAEPPLRAPVGQMSACGQAS